MGGGWGGGWEEGPGRREHMYTYSWFDLLYSSVKKLTQYCKELYCNKNVIKYHLVDSLSLPTDYICVEGIPDAAEEDEASKVSCLTHSCYRESPYELQSLLPSIPLDDITAPRALKSYVFTPRIHVQSQFTVLIILYQ